MRLQRRKSDQKQALYIETLTLLSYCTGSITRESAWKISYERGKVSEQLADGKDQHGTMMAVGIHPAKIKPLIAQVCEQFSIQDLTVACINSPNSITISGDTKQINILKRLLDDKGIFARKLKVNVAYHSPHMNRISKQYGTALQNLPSSNVCRDAPIMLSSVTGQKISPERLSQGSYWVQNMCSPVQFWDALAHICNIPPDKMAEKSEKGHGNRLFNDTIIEIGPHGALKGPITDILKRVPKGEQISYRSVLMRNQPASQTLLETIGYLHCQGFRPDLHKVNMLMDTALSSSRRPRVLNDLPEYPFNHSRKYWHESRLSKESRFRRNGRLDLLGKPVVDWNPHEAKWRNIIKLSELPWLASHKVCSNCIII